MWPSGLRALTIEPGTWKHQHPSGSMRHPGVMARQPYRTSDEVVELSYKYDVRLALRDAHSSMLALESVFERSREM